MTDREFVETHVSTDCSHLAHRILYLVVSRLISFKKVEIILNLLLKLKMQSSKKRITQSQIYAELKKRGIERNVTKPIEFDQNGITRLRVEI